jgi:ribosomal protein S18 acetylase RimI-like enzyme
MDALERAIAFMSAHEDSMAERIEPFRWGRALFNESLPAIYDLNFLRVERVEDFTAEKLASEAERLQRGLLHRRVNLPDEAAADRITAGFRELGWDSERHVVMVHRREPERSGRPTPVLEVREEDLVSVRRRTLAVEPWATPLVLEQMLAARHLLDRALRVRRFAAAVDSELVAYCDLYSDGRTGQVEDVATVPECRNRGLATTLVSHAVEESRRLGHDLTFLVADAEDWPKELYAKLGFDVVGRYVPFVRRAPGDPGPRRL